MDSLWYRDLGEIDYPAATALQESLVQEKQREKMPDVLLLLEHPHVFTIGRGGKDCNLLSPGEVPVYRTGRGGDVTYHGPGQLVVYPILDLRSKLRKDVHRYLRQLEVTTIETVKELGVRAKRVPPWTGIWIEKRKIASIGVAVKRGVTCHGLALNVNTDLNYFHRIIPCGLTWADMTSIQKETGMIFPMNHVKQLFLKQFLRIFNYADLKQLCREDIQTGLRSEPPGVPIISG